MPKTRILPTHFTYLAQYEKKSVACHLFPIFCLIFNLAIWIQPIYHETLKERANFSVRWIFCLSLWYFLLIYRIIPKISPGLIFGQSTFFWAHFRGGLFSGGAYFRDEICVRKEDGLIISAKVIKGIRIISL